MKVRNWWEADIDAKRPAVDGASSQIKRIHPLILIGDLVVLLVLGIVWNFLLAEECIDQGGIMIEPTKQLPHCQQ